MGYLPGRVPDRDGDHGSRNGAAGNRATGRQRERGTRSGPRGWLRRTPAVPASNGNRANTRELIPPGPGVQSDSTGLPNSSSLRPLANFVAAFTENHLPSVAHYGGGDPKMRCPFSANRRTILLRGMAQNGSLIETDSLLARTRSRGRAPCCPESYRQNSRMNSRRVDPQRTTAVLPDCEARDHPGLVSAVGRAQVR